MNRSFMNALQLDSDVWYVEIFHDMRNLPLYLYILPGRYRIRMPGPER